MARTSRSNTNKDKTDATKEATDKTTEAPKEAVAEAPKEAVAETEATTEPVEAVEADVEKVPDPQVLKELADKLSLGNENLYASTIKNERETYIDCVGNVSTRLKRKK